MVKLERPQGDKTDPKVMVWSYLKIVFILLAINQIFKFVYSNYSPWLAGIKKLTFFFLSLFIFVVDLL